MALTLGDDADGRWAMLECDAPGCEGHVSMRPQADDVTPSEAIAVLCEWAAEDGWWLVGIALCATHRHTRAQSLVDARYGPERTREAVKPEAAAAVAQRGLTAVH